MDPLGLLARELRRARQVADDERRRRPIDASGALPDGSRFDGVAGLRTLLLKHREDFVRTFTEKLLSYALGRGTEAADWPAVRTIVRDTAAERSSLVVDHPGHRQERAVPDEHVQARQD